METISYIIVLLLWLFFVVFTYIFFVYLIGWIWILRSPPGKIFYNKPILIISAIIFLLNIVVQSFMIYLYSVKGANLIGARAMDFGKFSLSYYLIFSFSLFLTTIQILFFFFSTNNLFIKFTEQRLYLLGLSLFYTTIVSIRFEKKTSRVILEYVYKQENNVIWCEKIYFFQKMKTTKFLLDNLAIKVNIPGNRTLVRLAPENDKNKTINNNNKPPVVTQKKDSSVKKITPELSSNK